VERAKIEVHLKEGTASDPMSHQENGHGWLIDLLAKAAASEWYHRIVH